MLQEYERKKEEKVSQFEHELQREYNREFRLELDNLQEGQQEYIHAIKEIAEG